MGVVGVRGDDCGQCLQAQDGPRGDKGTAGYPGRLDMSSIYVH